MTNVLTKQAHPIEPEEHGTFRIGNQLLYENDRVRVWEMRLAPGQRTERHRHQADYLSIHLTQSNLRVERPGQPTETIEQGPGFAAYHAITRSFVHTIENVGPAEHREIVVELKGPDALPETESAVNYVERER